MYSSSLPSTSYRDKDITSLIKLIERIRATGIYEQLESISKLSWEDFQRKFLLSINIQKTFFELFTYFQGLQNLKSRDILIAYSFIYYDMNTNPELYKAAKELIECIHCTILDKDYRSHLYQKIHKFERIYIPWKMDDRSIMLEKLSQIYWEYEDNYRLYKSRLSSPEKEFFLNEKKTKQEECINIMKKIDNLSYFNQYQPMYIDSQSSTLLLETLRKAFWDKVKDNLFKDTIPNYEPIFAIFNEMRCHIDFIHNKRSDILIQYDKIIDIEYFKQRHKYANLDISFWLRRLEFLIDLLIQLDDGIIKEREHIMFLKKIKDEIEFAINERFQFESCINGLAYIMTRLLELREIYERNSNESK